MKDMGHLSKTMSPRAFLDAQDVTSENDKSDNSDATDIDRVDLESDEEHSYHDSAEDSDNVLKYEEEN